MPQLIPVDHDPFAAADTPAAGPRMEPVDFDPFAGNAPASARLEPVDGDPFAGVAPPSAVPSQPADPAGNPIDTRRPTIDNPDGSFSTERTIGIEANGKFYNIPTIVNGQQLTEEQAIREFEAGRNAAVGVFNSQAEADAAARERSQAIGDIRRPGPGLSRHRRRQVRDLSKQFTTGVIDRKQFVSGLDELYNGTKESASPGLGERIVGALQKAGHDLKTGYDIGAAGLYHTGANALLLVNKAADYLANETGVGPMSKDTALGHVESWLRQAAETMAPRKTADDLPGKVYEGLGAAPAAIAQYVAGIRALGTIPGFAAVDALGVADQGPEAAAKAAVKGAAMGKIFKAAESLSTGKRVGALASAGGAQAAAEGGDAQDVVANATVMGTLGALGGDSKTPRRTKLTGPARSKTEPAPIPEPRETLQAQLDALKDGRKPAVLVTPGETLPELPAGARTLSLGDRGTLVYRDPKVLEAIRDGRLGEALGYGIDHKPEGATDVVTARDAQGRVVQDVVTDGRPAVETAARRAAGDGGHVETRPASEAIRERLQQTQAETAFPVEPISERTFLVRGGAREIRETLHANGVRTRGTYNPDRGGLVFRVKHAERIRAALAKPSLEKPATQRPLRELEHDAATSPKNALPQPTAAQIEAGNYKKAHARLHGLDITIENPKGSTRSGVDRGGKPWSVTMKHTYGYLKGTVGRDKDHLDVFLGPDTENPRRPVYVIDQVDPKIGRFDEAKIMMGFRNPDAARAGYLANYEPGWQGLGGMKRFTLDGFKQWLQGDTTKPVTAKITARESAGGDELPARGASARNAFHPGTAYVGFIDDAAIPRKPAARKPIRREDVLAPFLKALNVPLYQGRVKGKGRLGFYLPKKEAVRVKRMADLETTAHELAHLLDDRIPEIRRQWLPANKRNQAVRKELQSVSYDSGKLYEGFAEFVRLYMTQNAKARAAAPTFYRWFDDFIQKSEYGPAVTKARDDMHAWFEQDALNRAQSKIGQTRNVNESLDSVFSRFRQSVADDLEGVYRMERSLTGKINPAGAYETARLTRGSYAMVEGALTIGRPVVKEDGSFSFEGKGLQQILDPVSRDIDKWTLYAVGRSSKELMSQGREKLFTRAEIDAMVDLETPAFRKAFDEYQTWNRGVLDFAQRLGLINVDNRKLWQRSQYLPFYRVNQPVAGNKAGVQGNWSGIKALTGGTGNLNDVLGNMIQNAASLMSAAVRNEARVKIADMADRQRGGGRFMVRIPKEDRKVRLSKDQIHDAALRALGVSPAAARMGQIPDSLQHAIALMEVTFAKQPALLDFWIPGQAPFGDTVVAVLRNGKPDFYEVADPLLYRALSSLTRPGKHWLTRALSQVRRVGQATVTLTPSFMIANLARDSIMGGVLSRHGFKPFIDSIRGMQSRLKKDATYREFIANGGGFSSYLLDETAFRKHLARFYTKKGINYRMVVDTPGKALYALETIADAFEMSTRLGEFHRARAAGEHPRHAAYSAREVSTDFAMRGDSQTLGFLYDSVMFLKAGVNGLDRMYRGVAHDPNKAAIATKTGLIALMSMGLYALNRDNPLYDDLEDWNKDVHWHIFVPKPGTDETTPLKDRYYHFYYPKVWEVGAVASVAERAMEQILSAKANGEKFAKDFARITLDLFKLDVMPQLLKPLAEQAMNRNLFTDRPIETQSMQQLAPFARSGPYISSTLAELGLATRDFPESLQFRPARAEALLRGYFNTWAVYGLMLTDAIVADDKPDMRIDQYPVLKRFYAQEPAKHTRYETRFYDMLKRATELRRTLREMDRRWRPDIADELETRPEATEYTQLTRANKELQGINREIRAAYTGSLDQVQQKLLERHRKHPETLDRLRQDGTWTDAGALKRVLIDELSKERNDLLQAVVADVDAQRKQTQSAEQRSEAD